jgi:hypothetical protein
LKLATAKIKGQIEDPPSTPEIIVELPGKNPMLLPGIDNSGIGEKLPRPAVQSVSSRPTQMENGQTVFGTQKLELPDRAFEDGTVKHFPHTLPSERNCPFCEHGPQPSYHSIGRCKKRGACGMCFYWNRALLDIHRNPT